MIYLDNAATSLIKPQIVKDAVVNAINNYTANPGRSGHNLSQQVANMVYEIREDLKDFFNAKDYNIVFTKNCTEALNLAIMGTLKPGDHVVTTCYEHNSVLRPLQKLKTLGVELDILTCNLNEIQHCLQQYIKSNTKMVITTAVSNVNGEVANLKQISNICKQNNLIYLIDGAQSTGHISVDLTDINADMYAFAGHKGLFSITGVGGLIIKNDVKVNPILYGGTGTESQNLTQPADVPEGLEAGTIPTIAIASLGAGVEFLTKNFNKILKTEQNLCKFLYSELKKLKILTVYSNASSINVFSFNMLDMDSSQLANILNDEYGICVRSGLHCAPLIHKKLGTLKQGAVRISIDCFNTYQQINYLIMALKQIYAKYC